jgi:hypothetical protein
MSLGTLQKRILQALDEQPEMTYAALVLRLFGPEFARADRASMTRALRSLEAQGLVASFDAGALPPFRQGGRAVGLVSRSAIARSMARLGQRMSQEAQEAP